MKKLCCIICGKYRIFKNPKISYILEKKIGLSNIYSKSRNEAGKVFKEEQSVGILKILVLIENI